MFSIMPLKMNPWNGRMANQYSRPASPFGKKTARWSSRDRSCVHTVDAPSRATPRPGPHLGAQSSREPALDAFDPPEVQRVAGAAAAAGSGGRGVRPTPPTSRSSQPRIAQARGNEYQPFSPPMPSMTLHSVPASASQSVLAVVGVTTVARPVRVARQRIARGAGRRTRLASVVSTSPSSIRRAPGARLADTASGRRRGRDEVVDVVLAHDAVVLQRFDRAARASERGIGRHEVHPVRGEPRGEHRQGERCGADGARASTRSRSSSGRSGARRGRRCRRCG